MKLLSITILLLTIAAAMCPETGRSQVFCPDNINLERGNFTHWSFDRGNNHGATGITIHPITTPISYRERITSGSDTDFYGGFPIVDPSSGQYSLKLGNDSGGAQIDIARYTFTIPAGVDMYRLNYRYAVVLEDPNHDKVAQPYFRVRVYDVTTGDTINCANSTFVADGALPGFQKSRHTVPGRQFDVYYKPWSSVGINLNNLAGRTLTAEFLAADCAPGAHMGYGYVDMICGQLNIVNLDTLHCRITVPLRAPDDFLGYTWYTDNYSRVVAKGREVAIPGDTALATYHVVLTPYPGYGCQDTLSIRVSSKPIPIDAGADKNLCEGKGVRLQPSGASSYVWFPSKGLSCDSCTTPVASPTATTVYHVIGTDSRGCNGIDSILVAVMPRLPVAIDSGHAICEGDSIRLGIMGGIDRYWMPPIPAADSRSPNAVVYPHESKTYQCVVFENECFSDTLSQEVRVLRRPAVSLGPDITGLIGQTITLRADVKNATAISWQPWDALTCPSCYVSQHTIRGNKTYVAVVSNELGCSATDTINVIAACKGAQIYLPNTFTPNADGQNDRFYPHGPAVVPVYNFMIYDRWGEKIFSASNISMNNPALGWDGTVNNKPLHPDTYVYVMEIGCEVDKRIVLTGDISLIR
jgi:gliding motility-associated-like protein